MRRPIAGFFFTAFIVSLAGITAPLAYFIGFLIVLMLGSTLAQLAKHMPSAGGYYTYVSRAVHPRLGFLTSWMYILYSPLVGGPLAGFFGFIVQNELKSNWNIDVPWLWVASVLIFAPLTAYLQWRGDQALDPVHGDHRRSRDADRHGAGDHGLPDPAARFVRDQPGRLQSGVHPAPAKASRSPSCSPSRA